MKCARSVGDRFLSHFAHPKFLSLQRLKFEVWTSVENQQNPSLKRLTASVHGTLLSAIP